eukprot:TRINITY_DN5931_c3_g1_i7.p1 TRINITY_DN5931_c3_g1~~TRINITY_DN5931_c3_g1_i7.p1  ORF type:complete len:637 (+),score=44.50 TRINITY_DN5931_c3_g1_i7:195-2105(+)
MKSESTLKSSAWSVVFNICCIAIGLGVLSFPFAFRCAGLVGGLLLCIVCGWVTTYCMNVITRHASKHGCYTFQDLVKCSLGERASWSIALLVIVYLYGSCVAYQIVVGDTFHPLLGQILGSNQGFWADRRLIIGATGLLIVLPISLKRSAVHFAGVSSLAVLVIVFMGGVVFVRAIKQWKSEGLTNIEYFVWRPEAIYAVPIIIFAFQAHVQSCSLFFELDGTSNLFKRVSCLSCNNDGAKAITLDAEVPHQNPLQQQNKIRLMDAVVKLSFSFCGLVFAFVGASGYVLYSQALGSDIMNCLPTDDVFIQVVRGLVGLSALLHYPINQHVARAALDDLFAHVFGWQTSKEADVAYWRIVMCTIMFFVPCTVTAILVTDLGMVFHLLGGIASACFIFVIPGLMMVKDNDTSQIQPGEIKDERDVETGIMDTHKNVSRKSPFQPIAISKEEEERCAPTTPFTITHQLADQQFKNNPTEQQQQQQQISIQQQLPQLNSLSYSFTYDNDVYYSFTSQNNNNANINNGIRYNYSSNELTASSSNTSFSSQTFFEQENDQQKQQNYHENCNQQQGIQSISSKKKRSWEKRKFTLQKYVGVLLVVFGLVVVFLTVFTAMLEMLAIQNSNLPLRPKGQFPCVLH